MPISTNELISEPAGSRIRVELEPGRNLAYSLFLLAQAENYSGLGDWVERTLKAMTPDERQRHQLVMVGLHYAMWPTASWASFPAYLEDLSATSPFTLRDRMMEAYTTLSSMDAGRADDRPWSAWHEAERAAVLDTVEHYLDFLRTRFGAAEVDDDLESRAYAYMMDPPNMHDLIVSHLRSMWDRYLREEWVRVRPLLEESVRVFRQVDFSTMSNLQAARFITGKEQIDPHWAKTIEEAERLVFMPNAHIGPYLGKGGAGESLFMLFGARLPQGVTAESSELSRTELLMRLNALADENRLRILRWIGEHGETCSQELMRGLGLSQPAASRHLSQLAATGFLSERRQDGAKCYVVNAERLRDTLLALAAYVTLDDLFGPTTPGK